MYKEYNVTTKYKEYIYAEMTPSKQARKGLHTILHAKDGLDVKKYDEQCCYRPQSLERVDLCMHLWHIRQFRPDRASLLDITFYTQFSHN